MNAKKRILAGFILAAALGAAGPVAGQGTAAPNTIRAIEVSERGGSVEIEIRGSRAPSFTVFKLQDPTRLVVDLAGADLAAVSTPITVGKGGVIGVSTAQYQDQKSAVGRVVLALEPAAKYEVTPRGETVVVRVSKGELASEKTAAPRPEKQPVQEKVEAASAPAASQPAAKETPVVAAPEKSAEPVAAPAPPASDDGIVSRRVDEAPVKRAASAVTRVQARADRIEIQGNGQFSKFEVIELRNPPRLAIDLFGLRQAPRNPVAGGVGFKQIRFGRDDGKVRVVLDAESELPRYQVKRTASGLAILKQDASPPARADSSAPQGEPAPVVLAPPAPKQSAPAKTSPNEKSAGAVTSIRDLRFSQANGVARIELVGKARQTVSRPDPRTLVLTLEGAQLAKRLERSLDTSAFNGPVVMVSSFNQPSTGQVRVVVSLKGEAHDRLVETNQGAIWTVTSGAVATHDASQPVLMAEPSAAEPATAEAKAAGFAAEAPSYAASGAPQKTQYTGRRITLDFHDIDIRNLLRLIADVSKKNIVVADGVTGKVTVSLRNVPWDQALDLVLKSKGLGKEEMGNVIRIAKFEDIAKEQAAQAEAAKARAPLIPLKVRLIPVNYAQAKDIEKQVKDVLSERGTITTDERTNVLIVKDIQEALARAEGLVRNLDAETPQVLIESRIVEASSNFAEQIGVQWGGNASFTQATGNPTGLVFPNNVITSGAAGGGPTQGTANNPNYAVNLPAAIGQGAGGGIGFTFGSATGAFNLNLRLSALENRGVLKTISAPKIATIDNKEATIGQGLSIPFSQVSASGVNTVFIEAKLELKVTPHVTADGSILMKIKATNNQPNAGLTGANGQPSISKREAETSVMVRDGDTTVIGGIYTRSTSNQNAQVPFFSKIPVLGFFFKSTTDTDAYTELLIFITPRILNRSATAAVATGG